MSLFSEVAHVGLAKRGLRDRRIHHRQKPLTQRKKELPFGLTNGAASGLKK
jgi:hypothetical protein